MSLTQNWVSWYCVYFLSVIKNKSKQTWVDQKLFSPQFQSPNQKSTQLFTQSSLFALTLGSLWHSIWVQREITESCWQLCAVRLPNLLSIDINKVYGFFAPFLPLPLCSYCLILWCPQHRCYGLAAMLQSLLTTARWRELIIDEEEGRETVRHHIAVYHWSMWYRKPLVQMLCGPQTAITFTKLFIRSAHLGYLECPIYDVWNFIFLSA